MLFIFSANEGTNEGYELWKTDGAEEGTVMVYNVCPGGSGSYLQDFVVMGVGFILQLLIVMMDMNYGKQMVIQVESSIHYWSKIYCRDQVVIIRLATVIQWLSFSMGNFCISVRMMVRLDELLEK